MGNGNVLPARWRHRVCCSIHQVFQLGGIGAVFEFQLKDRLRKKATGKYVSPLELSAIYAGLKRKGEALYFLEQSYLERAPWLVRIQSDPNVDFLHSDPRYQTIVRRWDCLLPRDSQAELERLASGQLVDGRKASPYRIREGSPVIWKSQRRVHSRAFGRQSRN